MYKKSNNEIEVFEFAEKHDMVDVREAYEQFGPDFHSRNPFPGDVVPNIDTQQKKHKLGQSYSIPYKRKFSEENNETSKE